jgi:hypothetical protein
MRREKEPHKGTIGEKEPLKGMIGEQSQVRDLRCNNKPHEEMRRGKEPPVRDEKRRERGMISSQHVNQSTGSQPVLRILDVFFQSPDPTFFHPGSEFFPSRI